MSQYAALYPQAPWAFIGVAVLMGLIVGSFINVVVLRIPKGESIIRPASHCACGAELSVADNVPVIGWLILRGHARCCGRWISLRYPFTEALTALCFALCAMQRDFPHVILGMVFCSTLITACLIDWDTFLLLDRFTVFLTILGIVCSFIYPTMQGYIVPWQKMAAVLALQKSLLGALVGTAAIYWLGTLFAILTGNEAIGEGDLKLLGAIGAFTGVSGAVFSIFAGSAIGCLFVAATEIWKRCSSKPCPFACTAKFPEEMGETPATGVPFGPFLGTAGLLYYFVGPSILFAMRGILIPA